VIGTIELIAEITPKNDEDFAILEDVYLRGGFHVVPTLTDRNNISADRRKAGMRVAVNSTDLVYKLQADLTTWVPDAEATTTLQAAYDSGASIVTGSNGAMTLYANPEDPLAAVFIIKDANGNNLLQISASEIQATNIRADSYRGSILKIIGSGTVIVDVTDITVFRAVQYLYTIQNSDASGQETGKITLLHNGLSGSFTIITEGTMGSPCDLSFNAVLIGNELRLLAIAQSNAFSRILHLVKFALS
jgi:hypothetical protein